MKIHFVYGVFGVHDGGSSDCEFLGCDTVQYWIPNSMERALLEKLIPDKLTKKFTGFYGCRRIITDSDSPPLDPILSQMNPIHIRKSCFFNIYSSTTLSSTPGSPRWVYLFRFTVILKCANACFRACFVLIFPALVARRRKFEQRGAEQTLIFCWSRGQVSLSPVDAQRGEQHLNRGGLSEAALKKIQNSSVHFLGPYSSPWWWMQQVPLKRWWTSTRLHGATTQKTADFTSVDPSQTWYIVPVNHILLFCSLWIFIDCWS
jgi:hypothetical protein